MTHIAGIRFGIADYQLVLAQEAPWYKSKKLKNAKKQLPHDVYPFYVFSTPSQPGEAMKTRVELLKNGHKGPLAQQTFPAWTGIHSAARWVRAQAKKLNKQ